MKKKILIGALAVGIFVVAAYAAATKFTDVLVTGTLQVNGATTMNGLTLSGGLTLPVVNVAVSTPSAAGLLVRTSANIVYISTGATNPSQWSKVGAQ